MKIYLQLNKIFKFLFKTVFTFKKKIFNRFAIYCNNFPNNVVCDYYFGNISKKF